jgi:hypothetical protein
VLTNPKWEIFAQELAKGSSQLEAYVAAGYKPDDGHANRLAGYGRITARIAELQGNVAENTEVTIEGLILEADEVYRTAMKERQLGAANGALKLKAVFAGLYVEKSDNTHRYKNDAADWSRDELVTIINDARASRARIAQPIRGINGPDPVH